MQFISFYQSIFSIQHYLYRSLLIIKGKRNIIHRLMYQIVEVATQLREEAGANQVKNARLGMAQNIGGSGATVVTTILERV